jgi:hypothetical protein
MKKGNIYTFLKALESKLNNKNNILNKSLNTNDKLINSIINNYSSKELEIEARVHDVKNHKTLIDESIYNAIESTLDTLIPSNNIHYEDSIHKYLLYKNNNNLLIQLNKNLEPEFYKYKHHFDINYFYTDNSKIAANIEFIITPEKAQLAQLNLHELPWRTIRYKYRKIYIINKTINLQCHLTKIITVSADKSVLDTESWEVEIDYTHKYTNTSHNTYTYTLNDINAISLYMSQLLTLINDIVTVNLHITSGGMHRDLELAPPAHKHNNTKACNLLFNKPANLSKGNMVTITSRYSITEKADGVRYLLYITKYGNIYLISNKCGAYCIYNKYYSYTTNTILNKKKKTYKSRSSSTLSDEYGTPSKFDLTTLQETILDGEYIEGHGYYAFDCISYCGKLVYKDTLINRLITLNKIITNDLLQRVSRYIKINIFCKTHIINSKHLHLDEKTKLDVSYKSIKVSDTFSDDCYKLWTERKIQFPNYELDGIIFTPLDSPYLSTDSDSHVLKPIYKWKEDNTVDVLIKYDSSRKIWVFYTGMSPNTRLINEHKHYYFNPRKGNNKHVNHLHNGQIWEMLWNYTTRQFEPYRLRTDKLHPNAPLTITGTINIVKDPLYLKEIITNLKDTEADITQFGKLYYQEKGDDKHTRAQAIDIQMRNFHNKVKYDLINSLNTIKNEKVGKVFLLDLSCGRGGDINKYLTANVDVVLGIDISGTAINEARERWNNTPKQKKHNKDYYFIEADITKDMCKPDLFCSNTESASIYKRFINKYGSIPRTSIRGSTSDSINKSIRGLFNIIVSNFAVHYYYQTEVGSTMFKRNLKYAASNNGLFVGTLLDGSTLNKHLSNSNKGILEAKKDNKVFYKIDKKSRNEIIVSRIGWDNPIPEPLLYEREFVADITKCGFNTVKLASFADIYNSDNSIKNKYNLSNGEKLVSFLHKIFIFKRRNDTNTRDTINNLNYISKENGKTKKRIIHKAKSTRKARYV